jgi:glutathione S-transferase
MADPLVLHHYPQSPVSEKVRVALGLKGLAWRSVIIPRLPPKPDLMPLTGGYRLTPVMQVGADVYCDSLRIMAEIERRYPEPTLFPAASDGLAWGLTRWIDGPLFSTAISLVLGDAGHDLPADFAADRGNLYFGAGFDLDTMIKEVGEARQQLRPQLGWMEARLTDGRPFMLGDRPSFADAYCYYIVWFIHGRYSGGDALLAGFERLLAWEQRIAAIGHGTIEEMEAADALALAHAATPEGPPDPILDDCLGFALGDMVRVLPADADGPAVVGRLLTLSADGIAVGRREGRVGDVVVHLPRLGYRVAPA